MLDRSVGFNTVKLICSFYQCQFRDYSLFKKNGPNPAFSQHNGKYSTNLTTKRVDDVLGTRTWGGRMVGADESIEV